MEAKAHGEQHGYGQEREDEGGVTAEAIEDYIDGLEIEYPAILAAVTVSSEVEQLANAVTNDADVLSTRQVRDTLVGAHEERVRSERHHNVRGQVARYRC